MVVWSPSNDDKYIEFVEIATTGNAKDFGDTNDARRSCLVELVLMVMEVSK